MSDSRRRRAAALPRQTATHVQSRQRYWKKRLRSKAFTRALTEMLARELQALAKARVADVLDTELIRAAIRESDMRLINRHRVADLIVQTNRRVSARLSRRQGSLFDALGRSLVGDIEAVLAGLTVSSAQTEAFVGGILRQEFVRRLFTDIIFTSIVSFNQKVNPLFGGLTMRVLEDQIKGFIRLFMPMLIEQATAFAVSKDNRHVAVDFARAVIRQLLAQPLHNLAIAASPAQRKKIDAVIRTAVSNAKVEAAIRQTALAAWDDFYSAVRDQRVGDLLCLAEQADWLAEQCVTVILPVLARPRVLQLIATETAAAAGKAQLS